jgi:2-methylcitrate dehydratase PrpD
MAIGETFAPVSPVIDDLKRGFMPMTQYCSGWGALVGVSAALLAREGFTGISSTIDFSLSGLPDFGKSFEIKNVYFKPYPSCRWTHPSIEGTMELMAKHRGLNKDVIKKISINIFSNGVHLREKRPQTMESAQYSLPFVIGAVIVDGMITPDQFKKERLSDPNILRVADRVEVIHSRDLDEYFPKDIPSEIEIETVSGESHKIRVIKPKGDPKNPMTREEFEGKFRKLTLISISPEASEKLIDRIKNLDKLAHVNELMDIPLHLPLSEGRGENGGG